MRITIDLELSRLREGARTNEYGDLVSHTYGYTVTSRHNCGIRYTVLNGFRKYRRCFFPQKTAVYLTSSLLNVLHAAQCQEQQRAKLQEKRAAREQQKKQALKDGYRSLAAMERHQRQRNDEKCAAVAPWRERVIALEAAVKADPQPDLNDCGIAVDRDRFEGDALVLVNFRRTKTHRVRLADFLALYQQHPTKILRRNAGWTLPRYSEILQAVVTRTIRRVTTPGKRKLVL